MENEFEKRAKMLLDLGVDFNLEHNWNKNEKISLFSNFTPPFSHATWCELFMKDGMHYVGGCCGSLNHVQDIISSIIRFDSGCFEISDLAEIAELMIVHDGIEENEIGFANLPANKTLEEVVEEVVANKNEKDPWVYLPLIWHIVKDFWAPKKAIAFGNHVPKIRQAANALAKGLQIIAWERLFPESEDHPSQKILNKTITLSRIIPALKTMNECISELDMTPVKAFAIVDIETNQICANKFGQCIYNSMDEVNHLLNLWRNAENQKDEQYNLVDDIYQVRPVLISIEKGVEFLDETK